MIYHPKNQNDNNQHSSLEFTQLDEFVEIKVIWTQKYSSLSIIVLASSLWTCDMCSHVFALHFLILQSENVPIKNIFFNYVSYKKIVSHHIAARIVTLQRFFQLVRSDMYCHLLSCLQRSFANWALKDKDVKKYIDQISHLS